MNDFDFSYGPLKTGVRMDRDHVHIAFGPFKKYDFPLSHLQQFHVLNNGSQTILYLKYAARNGKVKKLQLFSEANSRSFLLLVNELRERCPSQDLTALDNTEAMKIIGAADPNKWAPIMILVVLPLTMALMMYPGLRHALDGGLASASVAEVARKVDLGTRNIKLHGRVLAHGERLTENFRYKGKEWTRVTVTYPIAESGWQEGDPLHVLVSFVDIEEGELDRLLQGTEYQGVIRDIWWEGARQKTIDHLKDAYSFQLDEHVVLVEVRQGLNDGIWPIAMGIVLLIVGGWFLFYRRAQRRVGVV